MFNSAEVAERIKSRSKEMNVQLKDVFERSGLNKNMMAGMRNGSMPKADNLAKIAEQLDCSVDYLLGRSEQKNQPTPVSEGELNHLDDMEQQLMSYVNRMTPEQKAFFLALLQTAVAHNQEKLVSGQASVGETVPEMQYPSKT